MWLGVDHVLLTNGLDEGLLAAAIGWLPTAEDLAELDRIAGKA